MRPLADTHRSDMVYATTFFSLLLATTAIALPVRGNEGVGGRLQVASTGQNSSASHEAKLDAQLEIQDALARTQSVSSAATSPGKAKGCPGKGGKARIRCSACVTAILSNLDTRAASRPCVSRAH